MESPGNRLLDYLEVHGILCCNYNPYLPCLFDIGCTWEDMTTLVDSHGLFLCKAFRKRTTYLSREVYYLLKRIRTQKALRTDTERAMLEAIQEYAPLDTVTLKRIMDIPAKEYSPAFDFLLENLYVTAIHNGDVLQSNWSTFLYGPAGMWERFVGPDSQYDGITADEARERLRSRLSLSMTEKDIRKFLS